MLKQGAAPSYFIEGMLYNVPANEFGKDYQKTVDNCWGWINGSNHGDLMCANGIHPLVRDKLATSWNIQGYIDFLSATQTLWNSWK